jgi:hypothetical protein
MSALNNAWNSATTYPEQWADPRTGNYPNAYQQMPQGLQPMRARPAPRLSDMPEQLLQEISADLNAQRMWENLSGDEQWRLIERHEKQVAQAREQEKIDAYDPNNDDAYSVSLSTAVDLWRAKHGDTWVREQTVYPTGDFYGELETRLSNNNCFERMEKYNRTWLRLKEQQ